MCYDSTQQKDLALAEIETRLMGLLSAMRCYDLFRFTENGLEQVVRNAAAFHFFFGVF